MTQTRSCFNSCSDFINYEDYTNNGILYKFRRRSLHIFRQERLHRLVHRKWESWKFQLKILEMRKRSRNNWSRRCVKKCYKVWRTKVKKTQLRIKLRQSCPGFEILFVKRKEIFAVACDSVYSFYLSHACVHFRIFHVLAAATKENQRAG